MFGLLVRQVLAVVLAGAGGFLASIAGPFDDSHRVFHWVARTYSKLVLRIFVVRLTVKGGENVTPGQPFVYVANHASMFDIPATIAGIPDRIHLIYKKELERIPLFGWGLKLGRTYIGIDRGKGLKAMRSLERAIERIRAGASVLLFAEGTRTSDGRLQPFKRGAFTLAVKTGVPVIPLTINGSFSIMPRHTFKAKPGTIELILGEPIPIPVTANGRTSEEQLMDAVRQVFETNYINQS